MMDRIIFHVAARYGRQIFCVVEEGCVVMDRIILHVVARYGRQIFRVVEEGCAVVGRIWDSEDRILCG